MLKFAVLLAFIAVAAAAGKNMTKGTVHKTPTFVGKFKLEADSNKAKYEKLFKRVGLKPADIKKFLGMVPGLTSEISLAQNKLTCKLSSGSTNVSNTFDLGERKEAKLLVGGTAKVVVFQQSNTRLVAHTEYGKRELNTVTECDDRACIISYTTRGISLITKWKRVGGGGGGNKG